MKTHTVNWGKRVKRFEFLIKKVFLPINMYVYDFKLFKQFPKI